MTEYNIPYGRQSIDEDDVAAVVKALTSDYLTQGPAIVQFERDFSKYVDAPFAVAVSNGTAALHLGCLALGLKTGERVITAPITFAATANSVLYCGGVVEFADIDRSSYTLSLEKVSALIESKPKGYYSGIIPVAFGGNPINTEAFREIADKHGLWLMVDACHAPGAHYQDSHDEQVTIGSGKYADLTVFSFHPVKHIATGEGGMITTRNKDLSDKLMVLRTHGITKENLTYPCFDKGKQGAWYYEMQQLGYNYRITDIQAALGVTQLKKAERGIKRRREIANRYRDAFTKLNVPFQQELDRGENAYHLFIIEVDDKLGLYNYLRDNGIYTQVHYIPVHLLPFYQEKGWKEGDFPNSEDYYERCLSLPMYPTLTDDEQDFVIKKIKTFLNA